MDLPPNIQKAFIAHAAGKKSWIECAAIGDTTTENLRQWRKHPLAQEYIDTAIELNVGAAHAKFSEHAEQLAEELIGVALDPKTRSYAKVQAIDTAFKIIQNGINEKQNREELRKIREALDQLEGGKPPEVIDVESD